MKALKLTCLAGLGVCLFVFAGCARERPVDAAAARNVLLIGNGPAPQSLDPHVSTGTSELNIQMALFEGLVAPHPETLEPLPAVAREWEFSEDGLTCTFYLREAARWSDGKPVVAADFVAAWRRALDPRQGTPYAYMLYVIEGAEALNQGKPDTAEHLGVRAKGERTLELRLSRPVPYLMSLLMHPVWYPVPSHALSEGGTADLSGPWTQEEGFIGNGPFVLAGESPGQFIEVSRNPHYWDRGTVALNGIRFHVFDDPAAEERAYLAGQLHVTDALPPARVGAYMKRNDPALRIDPYLGTYYILPNSRQGVLGDRRVRRALSLAIDRHALVDNLLGAGQRAAGGFVPDNMPGYGAEFPVLHAPDEAKRLLAEAGYPEGTGFPVLEYLFNSSESHRKIAEALQSMWASVLGIEVRLVNQEWRTYLQRRANGDFQLARAVWIGDYPEPSTFLDLWTSGSGNNWIGWTHPEYDSLIQRASLSMEPETRMELYRQAESVLLQEDAVIPLYYYVTAYLKDPAVRGWSANLLDWHPYKYLYFNRTE